MAKKKEAVGLTDRMYALFRSNQRSVGLFEPKSGKMHTEYRAPRVDDFDAHLRGVKGLGCVPITDNDDCYWGALDVDNHGQEEDIPIAPVADLIESSRLPLVPCRSKSGGIHVYAFFKKPIPAGKLRGLMAMWAGHLGFSGCEIFPKQSKLVTQTSGKKQLGNWINLPYMGGNDTVRYAIRSGKKLTFQQFIELAEKHQIADDDLSGLILAGHDQAPPCVQRMLSEGVNKGSRNEALYNITVYLRRAHPDDYEARAKEVNQTAFEKALPPAEAGRTITSAARPDYSYRCEQEPIRSLCNREQCIKRKFGISKQEFDHLAVTNILPEFGGLTKYLSEPVRWDISVDGHVISNISTAQLLEWRIMRELIADHLTRIVPVIKPVEWERILGPLMAEARIVEAPDDASITGLIRERLREFASKTDLTRRGENIEDRKALIRGLPVVQFLDGERMVVFRGQDFVNYLKRTKSEELKGINLWFAVKKLGVQHNKMRAGDHNINVWYIPVSEIMKDKAEVESPEFKTDL